MVCATLRRPARLGESWAGDYIRRYTLGSSTPPRPEQPLSYRPPIFRSPRFGQSPGQIFLIVILVLLGLMIYSGSGDPGALLRSARNLAFLFPALIISLSFHEFNHALVATWLGDDTARSQGRLTLNPWVHLDPLGTMMLVITVILGFGIGWAKPVPVNPWRLSGGPRAGMGIVAIAGPIANLIIAYLSVQVLKFLGGPGAVPEPWDQLLFQLAFLNIALAVFNMLPIPPLDGYRVLLAILPSPMANSFQRIEPYGPMILLLVVFLGGSLVGRIVSSVGVPILRAMAT